MPPGRRFVDPALVIVPSYNESESVGQVIARFLSGTESDVEMLVVDDASPDGTADVVRNHMQESPRIHLLERAGKLGLGSAYLDGFRWALQRDHWAIVEMDADLSHDPAAIPELLSALSEGADLVIGSRYVPGGRVENWSPLRRALSRAGNVYARLLLGFDIKDSTSGFRAYRAEALADQDLDSVRSEGYAFQIEMAGRLWSSGGRVVEIPITFVERSSGRSKLSRRIVFEALCRVAAWGIRDRLPPSRSRPPARERD